MEEKAPQDLKKSDADFSGLQYVSLICNMLFGCIFSDANVSVPKSVENCPFRRAYRDRCGMIQKKFIFFVKNNKKVLALSYELY